MLNRRVALIVLGLTLVLGACRPPEPGTAALVTGIGNVKVDEARYVTTGDAGSGGVGGGPATYVVAKVDLTNDTPRALYPVIAHFALIDPRGHTYTAVDSGSTALLGASNDTSGMQPGETRTFTIGFPSSPDASGKIQYDY